MKSTDMKNYAEGQVAFWTKQITFDKGHIEWINKELARTRKEDRELKEWAKTYDNGKYANLYEGRYQSEETKKLLNERRRWQRDLKNAEKELTRYQQIVADNTEDEEIEEEDTMITTNMNEVVAKLSEMGITDETPSHLVVKGLTSKTTYYNSNCEAIAEVEQIGTFQPDGETTWTVTDLRKPTKVEEPENKEEEETMETKTTTTDINNEEEETTMKTTFTTLNGTTYTMNPATNRYAKTVNGKAEYEAAKHEYDLEQEVENLELHPTDEEVEAAQAELDKEPCHVDRITIESDFDGDTRFWTIRVNGKAVSNHYSYDEAKAEAAKLGRVEDEAQDPELDQIMDETGLEASDAELERNIRNEQKKPRKARKSKDIAYEGHGKTLTAKQVDFIHHLSDSCFWEHGLESTLWIDCLCDEIEGQFAGKPMTVGAMVSTLCEKGLGYRAVDSLTDMTTGRSRKATYFALTDLGKEIAKELGLE